MQLRIYGPYEKAKGQYTNVICQFLWSMKNGERNQSRDFIHVSDIVEAKFLAAQSSLSGEIINVGSGTSTTIKNVVYLLAKYLGKNVRPKYVPNPVVGYVKHTLADVPKQRRFWASRKRSPYGKGFAG